MADAQSLPEQMGIGYGLRTALEVTLLGFVATSIGPLAMIGLVPVANFFGGWALNGISDLLMTLAGTLAWVLPFAAPFYYGFKRQRRLSFPYVLLGWAAGIVIESAIVSCILRLGPTSSGHRLAGSHVPVALRWLLWSAWLLVFAILPTLLIAYGQMWRLRLPERGHKRP